MIPEGAVVLRDGRIENVMGRERFARTEFPGDTRFIDLKGLTLSPGFIDTHIHGIGGYDTFAGTAEAILAMSRELPSRGVTTFYPTIYAGEEDKMIDSIRAVAGARGREGGARIGGIHLEGPFISRDQTGVQQAEGLSEVDIKKMGRFVRAGEGLLSLMTVAPELKNMRELAVYCLKKGIVLSAGHTNATYENMLEGMEAGILHSTHFFNAMRRLHHRDPGCIGAILIHPEISCEIIADGHHVHPALIKLLYRDKPVDKIILVTDSLGPTEQESGEMRANGERVYLKEGVFHREKDGVIAGSSLTMIGGIANLCSWGIPLKDALSMATANPARLLDREDRGFIIPGKRADLVAFDGDFRVNLTLAGGEILYSADGASERITGNSP